jgi:hypothetical protein
LPLLFLPLPLPFLTFIPTQGIKEKKTTLLKGLPYKSLHLDI